MLSFKKTSYIKLKQDKVKTGHAKWWSPLHQLGVAASSLFVGGAGFPSSFFGAVLLSPPLCFLPSHFWLALLLSFLLGACFPCLLSVVPFPILFHEMQFNYMNITKQFQCTLKLNPLVGSGPLSSGGAAFLLFLGVVLFLPFLLLGGAAFRPSTFTWHCSFPSFLDSPLSFSFSWRLVPLWGLGA